MTRSLKEILCSAVVLAAFAVPAAAQDAPKADVSGGYQYLQGKAANDEEYTKFGAGWYADVAFNVHPMFAVVADVGGNYKTETEGSESFHLNFHEYLFGGRVGAPAGSKVVPFGQILIGAVHGRASAGTEHISGTSFGFDAGAGVNVMPRGSVGLRLGIDYLHVNEQSDGDFFDSSINAFRFTAGVVFGIH